MGNDVGSSLFWTMPRVKTIEEDEATQMVYTSEGQADAHWERVKPWAFWLSIEKYGWSNWGECKTN